MNDWTVFDEWVPSDGYILEDAALLATKSNTNKLVVAGPGSGKTELLAQRACYLLETNTCKNPKRILAISFKKDAATNLKDRVESRCGNVLSRRFDSMTYDAFAKSMLDQFINGIENEFRPEKDYEIVLKDSDDDGKTKLSFKSISRLATKIMRINPLIKRALQLTYSHVFLDEFQDTTDIQYDLLKICFMDSTAVITAVGDGKQRIMLWAGAKKTVFGDYQKDFKAEKATLLMNHRSAPRLVEIQKAMYGNLKEQPVEIRSSSKWEVDSGSAYLRYFDDELSENEAICNEIIGLLNLGSKPRDICIIAKQTVEVYSENIIIRLAESGIKARYENIYQDLLKEELVQILTSILILSTSKTDAIAWRYLSDIFYELERLDENSDYIKREKVGLKLQQMLRNLTENVSEITDSRIFTRSVDHVLEILSYERLVNMFPKYKDKEYFLRIVSDFNRLIWDEYLVTNDWKKAIRDFIGENSIPVMTIHKSKGLEFDTVFFIGLEDSAFWNFKKQPDENKSAFFVALSRAKNRVDFTFCKGRQTRFKDSQSNTNIDELYDMLLKTGLVEVVGHN